MNISKYTEYIYLKCYTKLDMVGHTYNPSS